MKPVLLLLCIFAFSVLAHQEQITQPRVTPTPLDSGRPSVELMPCQPENHTSPQLSHWKSHWFDHTAISHLQAGHFVTYCNDDSSDSPIHTYSTWAKTSDERKKQKIPITS